MPKTDPQNPRTDRLPILKAALWSLEGSVRCIFIHIIGRLSRPRGEIFIKEWWTRLLGTGNATVTPIGREQLDEKKPYVFMSNHTSWLDIPAIFAAVDPMKIRMVSKASVKYLPLFGSALQRLEFIFIDREVGTRALKQLEKARETLSRGVSVWVSPEGTRSRTGKLGPFKKGGFRLAIQLGIPVVPTWIEGASDLVPPGGLKCSYNGEIVVRFGEPIPTEGLTKRDINDLMKRCRAAMLRLPGVDLALVDGGDSPQSKIPPELGKLEPAFMRRAGYTTAVEAIDALVRERLSARGETGDVLVEKA